MQGHCGPDLCARWSWSGILFLNDRKSSCEVNSSLLVRVLKLRFCAVLRLKRWSVGCSAAVSGWSLWEWWQPVTAVTRVNGSNVGGAPSFFNPRQTPEQSESVTTFCSDRFFLLVSPSLHSVSVHLTRNFHSNFYHKEKCVYWIKTFSSNVLHQDTVCISVFRINRLHSESLEVLKVYIYLDSFHAQMLNVAAKLKA